MSGRGLNPRREGGLSLVELLVALALGVLLTSAVVGVFVTNRETEQVESTLSRLQQSGRVAVELLDKDIRRAGYDGCNSILGIVDVAATGATATGVTAFRGLGSTLNPPAPPGVDVVEAVARAGSDVVLLSYAEYLGDDLIPAGGEFETGDTTVSLTIPVGSDSVPCQLENKDMVLFSNCASSHVFRATTVTGCPTTTGPVVLTFDAADNAQALLNTGFRYLEDSDVAEYLQVLWYVADTGRDQNGADVYALYRLLLDDSPNIAEAEEMVEGVEFLRVEAGERVGNTLRFVDPNNLPGDWDWNNVEAFRYAMLVQSFEQVTDAADTATYRLLSDNIGASGSPAHGGGRYVRKVFSSSQALRNTAYGG